MSAQSLNQIDPNKLWLVNLYAPFDGIEAKWKAADGTSAKMGVATGAAKAFLNNLQATLTSTGGISSSFSSWVSATAKSRSWRCREPSPSTCNRPRPARPWRASSTRAAARRAAGNVDIKALNSTQRMNLVGNIILPSMSIGGKNR